MVDNHVFEEPKDNDEIGLWGVDSNLFEKYEGRRVKIRIVLVSLFIHFS